MAVLAEHCDQSGRERDKTTAAKTRLIGLAVLEHLRVETQARIDEKHAFVDQTHLYRHGHSTQHGLRRRGGIGRNAVRPGEVVEGAMRQHAHGAALQVRRLRHRIDRAIAAHGNNRSTPGASRRSGLLCGSCKLVGPSEQQLTGSPIRLQRLFDHLTCRISIVATRGSIDDEQQPRRGVNFRNARRLGYQAGQRGGGWS
ncbi:hypothetical protein GALL_536170 [mine drainage metagenome]|uniref:Uncharacterized protein n=1 Tax=mine drainage metagenome TaxID=410659 RepID=A0A1J5PAJ5_9ZZZZ